MSTHHGNSGVVRVGVNAVAEVRSFTLDTEIGVADDTVMGDTWNTHLVNGNKSWSGNLECWWDETDTNGQEALDEGDSVTLHLLFEGAGGGSFDFTGTATVTKVGIAATRDATVSRTIEFQGNGALTRTTL